MKILALDIETAPNECYTWGLRKQNIAPNQIKQEGYILMWCASWVGQSRVFSDSLINHKLYFSKKPTCDRLIMESIYPLIDKADIILGQNCDRFDLKWLNAQFIKHDMDLPSPYETIDTLTQSKAIQYSISHSLDFNCKKYNFGGKTPHDGMPMWIGCMNGDKKSWNHMLKYCKNDVRKLVLLYQKLKKYMKKHPNYSLYEGGDCVMCGGSSLERRGFSYTKSSKYQRYRCNDCGRWQRDKAAFLTSDRRFI